MIIGTVPYYNTLPLVADLNQSVVHLPPQLLTRALLRGDIDVGLIPTFGILKNELKAYPEAGLIGCNGAVKSVGFFTRDGIANLAEVESIYFDTESQTSVHLGRILLKHLYQRNLRSIREIPLARCHEADAQLLIGDKALFFREDGYRYWDLGTMWKELTGTGFIFACWASKKPLDDTIIRLLTQARKTGTQYRDKVLEKVPESKREIILNYLTYHIAHENTENLQKGFELYKSYLYQDGWI